MLKKITRTGYGQRIGKAFGGVIIGLIFFISSFGLLYWNEGRQDMSEIAKTATEISANQINSDNALEKKLVSLTGKLASDEKLSDDYLQPGNYIALKRKVEIFAWIEKTKEETHTETGGSEITETTYTYDTDWTSSPEDSSDFESPENHYNPTKIIEDSEIKVKTAGIGVYAINPEKIDLPPYGQISLTEENVILDNLNQQNNKIKNNYIFTGQGTLESPQVGDMRISYEAVNANINVTAFGRLNSSQIDPYVDEDGNKLYRLFAGTKEEAINSLHGEHVVMMWILRVVGFVMMWIGMSSLFAPLTTIADVLPILGSVSKGIVKVITFMIALVLSVITIFISMILHNVVALLIVGLIIIAVIVTVVFIFIKAKNNKQTSV